MDISEFVMKTKPKGLVIALLLFGASRMLIELFFYYKNISIVTISASYSMLYYVFVIYTSITYWGIWLRRTKAIVSQTVEKEIYLLSVPLWLIYPLVPVITILTKSSYSVEILLFKWIPTFLTNKNFFPTGMIAVIPVIVVYYVVLFHKKLNTSVFLSAVITVISCAILYILFYQWFLYMFYYLYNKFNYPIAFGCYHFIMAIYFLIVSKQFLKLFPNIVRVFTIYNLLNLSLFGIFLLYGFYELYRK